MKTFKTSTRTAVLIGVIYFVMMTCMFAVLTNYNVVGTIIGALAGIAFCLVLIFAITKNNKKGEAEVEKIAKQKRVLCNGSANSVMLRGFRSGGWLILTDDELLFKSSKLNIDNSNITIPLTRIRNLSTAGRRLVVECIDAKFIFEVVKAKEWKEIAHEHILSKMKNAQL